MKGNFVLILIIIQISLSRVLSPSKNDNNQSQKVAEKAPVERKLLFDSPETKMVKELIREEERKNSSPLDSINIEKQNKLTELKTSISSFLTTMEDLSSSVTNNLSQISQFIN